MLQTRATRRLAALRAKAGKVYDDPTRWRETIRKPYRPAFGQYAGNWQPLDTMGRSNPPGRAYYCDAFPVGWRAVHENDTGWHCDEYGENTATGHVLQLPSRGGVPQYLPAISFTGQDGVILYPLDTFDTWKDAAQEADRHAEIYAEQEREDEERYQAEQRIEAAKETIADCRARLRALVRELKAKRRELCNAPSIIAALRAAIVQTRENSREAWKLLRDNV